MAASISPGRRRTWPASGSDEGDSRDQAAIIRLAAMGGAAVTEEPLLVRIGAQAQIRELSDARIFQAHADEGGQIEHRVARALARREEAPIVRALVRKAGHEIGADLIGLLAD